MGLLILNVTFYSQALTMENFKEKSASSYSTFVIILSILALMFMSGVVGFLVGKRSPLSSSNTNTNFGNTTDPGSNTQPGLINNVEKKVLPQGSLVIEPSSFSLNQGEDFKLQVIYKGVKGMNAAKIKFDMPDGLEVRSLDTNPILKLVELINSPENAEIHFGRLAEGDIEPDSVLFDLWVRADKCVESGAIEFSVQTQVPEIDVVFENANFFMDC
jgi:hypothetical protein